MFDKTKPTISLENAQIYQNNHLVLKDVSFEISKGEFVYLIGRTGSGKSSLLKTLYGDLNLKQGNAQIAGYKLEKLKESEIPFLRRRMGIIFQDFQLLEDRNVFQNLKFVLEATDWKNSKISPTGLMKFLLKSICPQKNTKNLTSSQAANNKECQSHVHY